jgi:hypothetical protein
MVVGPESALKFTLVTVLPLTVATVVLELV